MARRPRIAITMRLELQTARFYLGRDYSEAVYAAGGVPLHLGLIPDEEYIREALADVDGVLLPGSNTDVDPQFYDEGPHHRLGTVIPEKDLTDRMVIAEAERRNIPLLGICYGMQALNVYRGGSLVQDIESEVKNSFKHEQGAPATRTSHGLIVGEQGILASLNTVRNSNGGLRVNSSHHQAIKRVGSDLVETAWAPDGIIECLEDPRPERFILGVQWHPELSHSTDRLSYEIFERFIAQCSSGMMAADVKSSSGAGV